MDIKTTPKEVLEFAILNIKAIWSLSEVRNDESTPAIAATSAAAIETLEELLDLQEPIVPDDRTPIYGYTGDD